MKNLNYLFLSIVLLILVSCNNKKSAVMDNKAIAGIWQNTSNPNTAIEFTEEGNYYLRINGERLLIDDSTAEKYSYNPLSTGNNLIIYGNSKAGNTQSKLVILNPGHIKISVFSQGNIVTEAEFTKMREE